MVSRDRRRHGGNGRFVRSPETTERRTRLAQMIAAGSTFDEAAKALGYSDRNNARRAFLEHMEETAKPTEAARRRALAKLDLAEQAVWDVLERQHVVVSNGRVVHLDDKPIKDDGPILAAVAELRQIEALRARYEGTFAPTQSQVQATVTAAGDDTWQETVRAAHNRRAAARAQLETPADDPAPDPPAEPAG